MTCRSRPRFNVTSAIPLPVAERQGYLAEETSLNASLR